MIVTIAVLTGLFLLVWLFVKLPKFGTQPTGRALAAIKNSTHYRKDKFQNLSFTPSLAEGVTYLKVMKEFFFGKRERVKPATALPSQKSNLVEIPTDKDVLVWFGHSSYFLQIDGKKILVDPVLNGSASPLKFTTRSFKGADVYTTDEIPEIDLLLITHDHWDHLDYDTLLQLRPK